MLSYNTVSVYSNIKRVEGVNEDAIWLLGLIDRMMRFN